MLSALKTCARKTGLNQVYHALVRVPKNTVQKSLREGGPVQQWKTEQGRLAMKDAAVDLPPLSPPPEDDAGPLKVYFLTGENFWYQSLFCFYSLQQHTGVRVTPVFYDDGSLTDADCAAVRRVVPWAEFVLADAIKERLDAHLPADRYPTLRNRRVEYVHLRKLTDFHAGGGGYKLVLDSDMLFFDTPTVVLDWLRDPHGAFHMVDCEETYGYSRELMERLAGAPIPERLNVGFAGLRSDTVDFDALEHWCRRMLEVTGASYVQEQAMTAMLMAGRDRTVAPRPAYMTKPSVEEGRSPTATLHHYVAESKRAYFQHGWRHVA
jgi:hypothetical protein